MASLTRTRVKWPSICPAGANGIHVASRTRLSARLGVKIPGSSASSSSRGEKPLAARGAGRIAAVERDRVVVGRRQLPFLPTVGLQGPTTLGTPWSLCHGHGAEVRRRARQGGVLQHPSPYLSQSL